MRCADLCTGHGRANNGRLHLYRTAGAPPRAPGSGPQHAETALITRQNAAAAVVIDKEEYDGIMETLHLLRSPANAARLLKSIATADAGQVVGRDLIEP